MPNQSRTAVLYDAHLEPDRVTDVIVVGSGAAGISSALSALREGAEVIMLESQSTLGGTTLKSSAWAWYPNHAALNGTDGKPEAMEYMARLSSPERYDPTSPTLGLLDWQFELLEAFYDHAAEAVAALEADGVHQIPLSDFPDYYSFLSENRTPRGRSMRPATPDGEGAGADAMIDQGAASIRSRGGTILTEHKADQLLLEDGRVSGLVARHGDDDVVIRANRGVVFASGGFAQNEELRRESLAAPIFGACATHGATGRFVDIGRELGSPLRNMTYPWMTLMVLEQSLAHDPETKSMFHPPGDSMLFVNGDGERTLNEKAPYNEMAQMFQRWDVRQARYPDLFQFMVWDQACQDIHGNDRRGNPIPQSGAPAPHVVSAPTLAELAVKLSERVAELHEQVPALKVAPDFSERLQASVERFNAHAVAGNDPDFARGETAIELAFNGLFSGGDRSTDNPVLHPLAEEGPFYATILVPAALDTKGGPSINRRAEVIDGLGQPIPGLFGAGNCVGSASGKSYWAAGATIGPAVTFGLLAGRHAAQSPVAPPLERQGATA